MKQELVQLKKKFVPHAGLMDLAGYIRGLTSDQVRGRFTYSDMLRERGGMDNRRCVLGALMVEVYGAKDNSSDIETVLRNTKIFDEMAFRVKVDYNLRTSIDVKLPFTMSCIVSLADRFVRMNDTGRTFDEMANWAELEAYNLGHY